MADTHSPDRTGPLAAYEPVSLPRKLAIDPGAPTARFTYRGSVETAGDTFGFTLPSDINEAQTDSDRTAIRLGPDEWLLIAPDGSQAEIVAAFGKISAPHSLVDISHRNTSIVVEGRRALDVMATASPLDLHETAFPIGMATRTILGKAEVILWRQVADRFHIEVWRSFADYLFKLLSEGAREYRVPQRGK
ncbi:MAG: sarcosine oxidase subunit gamma family protein [Pseudomonadota bacterium]